jgi:peptidoglycan/xylan/chitin deacetylase (PgdA/CDA1 family)
VPLEEFETTVRLLRRFADIAPLRELVGRRGRGRAGLVALTFDDGYAALLEGVRQTVEREQVPITVFVVSDAARTGSPYWWDRLEDVLPNVSADRRREFERAVGVPPGRLWGHRVNVSPFTPVRRWILTKHRGRWPAELEPALQTLERDAGMSTAQRSMTLEELERLAASPFVEFGVHTRSHPVLPLLNDEELEDEVAGCYSVLRTRSLPVIPVLACPFGEFDQRTLGVAYRVGMRACLALGNRTFRGLEGSDPLPRFCVTAGQPKWRLGLRLLAVEERVRALSPLRSLLL